MAYIVRPGDIACESKRPILHTDAMHENRAVDIRPLKRLSSELLSGNSMLKRVLASESDAIPATEFVAKLGTWLAILGEELGIIVMNVTRKDRLRDECVDAHQVQEVRSSSLFEQQKRKPSRFARVRPSPSLCELGDG